MRSDERDIYILKKIIKYCIEANETITRFGDSLDILKADSIYKNASAMCVLQIGELVGNLSEEFIKKYKDMPWKQIKGMRNIAAHGYEEFDVEILWQTLKTDLPSLHTYCNEILQEA